ncbi:MAG: pyruvate, phosphate dikinase, partial [Cyanobacteria bacterium]|nr:pyruvate, phosphate dikinase [Cyanobacteriota bacterium]
SQFMEKYGHLRPGTYDILSLRYDQRAELLADPVSSPHLLSSPQPEFKLDQQEENALFALLSETNLGFCYSPNHLMEYCSRAISGREFSKFVFTQSVSTILELLALWGETFELSRDEVSFTRLDDLLDTLVNPILSDPQAYYKSLALTGQEKLEVTRALRLGYLIREVRDIYVIPLHRSCPNFVTSKSVEGEPLWMDNRLSVSHQLDGKIICIENADPGFDWIFGYPILGLITKFGGSNSHMAIRCTEFQIPAAIGCGEQTFERLVNSRRVELNCGDKILRVLSADFTPVFPDAERLTAEIQSPLWPNG